MANLGEIKLALKIGVGAAINDAQSAEQPVQALDFLAGVAGFGVLVGGWTPQVPTVKKGGVWADSSVSDGRELTAASMGNVVETITLTSVGADMNGRYYLQKELRRYAQMARDFWQTDYQIEPVYLEWWAEGSCAPQYALVYNLDIANQQEAFSAVNVGQVVITVEREPYWRAVRPGGHPKEYTFYMRGFMPGVDWTYADLDVDDAWDNLADLPVYNAHSWNTGKTTHGRTNWIDIPGDLISGDAPALTWLALATGTSAPRDFYIGRSTKPTSLPVRTGQEAYTPGLQNYMFTAPDADLETDATLATSGNVLQYRASNQTLTQVNISFATATLVDRIRWDGAATIAANGEPLSFNLQRGRFMVFVLNNQTGGSAGDIEMRAYVEAFGGDQIYTPLARATTTSSTWTYLGVMTLPPANVRAPASFRGVGLEVGVNTAFDLVIQARRNTGAATLSIGGMMLVPIDEESVFYNNAAAVIDALHLDETGYLNHGLTGLVGMARDSGAETIDELAEVRGDSLALTPQVTNRLYVFLPTEEDPDETRNVHLNIVPRWSGARDDCTPLDANGTYGGLAALSDDSDLILLDDMGYILLNG